MTSLVFPLCTEIHKYNSDLHIVIHLYIYRKYRSSLSPSNRSHWICTSVLLVPQSECNACCDLSTIVVTIVTKWLLAPWFHQSVKTDYWWKSPFFLFRCHTEDAAEWSDEEGFGVRSLKVTQRFIFSMTTGSVPPHQLFEDKLNGSTSIMNSQDYVRANLER